jgi:Sulfotransferase domain
MRVGGASSQFKATADVHGASKGRVRVLYIGGAGRSGSTLLCRVIGEQPHFYPLGEALNIWQLGVIDNRPCSCGSSFHKCPFWRDVADSAPGIFERTAAGQFATFSTKRLRTRHIPKLWTRTTRTAFAASVPPGYLQALSRLYESIQEVSGAKIIVDSSKNPMYGYLIGLVDTLQVTSVQLVRDPRAVAFSWQRRLTDPQVPETTYLSQRQLGTVTLEWIMSNLSMEIVSRVNAGRQRRLSYEEFVSAPLSTIRDLAEFAGEAFLLSENGPEREMVLPTVHMVSGNPNRFATGKIPIELDNEWRSALKGPRWLLVTTMTLPFLGHYGYHR